MFDLLRLWSGLLIRLVRPRRTLLMENLALRQQLAVFQASEFPSQTGHGGQDLLGAPPPLLVSVEDSTHRRVARYRCALASCGLPSVLAVPLARA